MTGPKGRLSESTTSAAVESEGCLIAANQTSGMNAKVNGRFQGLGSKAPEQ